MAAGVPVISTYHGGIPELVEDGISGFLVPEKNVDELANHIAYLINHPEKWSEIGYSGRDKVLEYFDINRLNDCLVEIYQQLMQT
jgi:colanic acid/amylovoran biosynthesis glycosyltransferase